MTGIISTCFYQVNNISAIPCAYPVDSLANEYQPSFTKAISHVSLSIGWKELILTRRYNIILHIHYIVRTL